MKPIYKKLLTASKANSVVPVITIERLNETAAIGERLQNLGYTVLEVTLRTTAALDAIRMLKLEFPNLIIGAGTIITPDDASAAIDAGSDFLVTPATPIRLGEKLSSCTVPVLPGCATATEAQTLYEMGFEILKFFPAEANGGVSALKSLSAPLPHLKFMPTGGISATKAEAYLALPNVLAIGGSWMI